MQAIKTGVIGLGRAGWDIHVKAIQHDERYCITEVADPDELRRNEAAGALGCRAFSDLSSLLKEGDSELIVVATPNNFHESDTVTVLEAGRHCICEKPMAGTYAGAKRVVEAATRIGRKLFVHHQSLFSDEYNFLREIVESGILGEVHEIRFNWASYSRRNDWQTLRKNGGGLLNVLSPHLLTCLLPLLGSPVQGVWASIKHIKDAGDTDDHVHLLLRAENGRVGDAFISTCCALPIPRFILIGSTGTVVSQTGETATFRYYEQSSANRLEVIEGAAAGRKYGTGEVLPWKEITRPVEPEKRSGAFYDNVYGVLRESAPMVVTMESALEVSRVIELARGAGGF